MPPRPNLYIYTAPVRPLTLNPTHPKTAASILNRRWTRRVDGRSCGVAVDLVVVVVVVVVSDPVLVRDCCA